MKRKTHKVARRSKVRRSKVERKLRAANKRAREAGAAYVADGADRYETDTESDDYGPDVLCNLCERE